MSQELTDKEKEAKLKADAKDEAKAKAKLKAEEKLIESQEVLDLKKEIEDLV